VQIFVVGYVNLLCLVVFFYFKLIKNKTGIYANRHRSVHNRKLCLNICKSST